MKIVRRLGAASLSAVIVGAFLVGPSPAAADTPEVFAGTAGARALNLSVLGIKLTVGSTNASANSTPMAKADGAGVLLIPGTTTSAAANGPNASQSPPKACVINLPIQGILNLSAACSESSASTTNNAPTANSAASVAAIDVGVIGLVTDLLKPITDPLVPVADQLVGQVTGLLQPVLGSSLDPLLGGLGIDADDPVSSLLEALDNATNLAQVRLGTSTSNVTTTAQKVTAVGNAQAGQVDVLPGLAAGGSPLISVVIGSAKAVAEYDRGTGTATPSFDPALLTLKVLGLTVPVAFGAPVTLFPGTVLESTISLGAGRSVTNPDGTVAAVADGVKLELLKGLNGGIVLELAHAEAAAGGKRPTVSPKPTTAPPPGPRKELVRTGGPDPMLPIGAALLLGALVLGRVARARR
ncbi:MAG TPA: hypothetical protein VG078_07705 [Acidimicrobiales bacterium]|nr:hypothetical protein [Acidimicrobiales bacterium]